MALVQGGGTVGVVRGCSGIEGSDERAEGTVREGEGWCWASGHSDPDLLLVCFPLVSLLEDDDDEGGRAGGNAGSTAG